MPIFVASFRGLPHFVVLWYMETEEVRKLGKAGKHLSHDMDASWEEDNGYRFVYNKPESKFLLVKPSIPDLVDVWGPAYQ